MGEQIIGQILAYAPVGEDGIWPAAPMREILDRPALREMRIGFARGTLNKRGVVSKAPDEGGEQERKLTAQFRRYAEGLITTHPYLAESLESIAKSYETEARREDDEAAMRGEWY